MLKLFLWLRYLRKRRIVLLSIAAVAISCALLIVVASLFDGFISAFEQSAADTMGDIVLSPPEEFLPFAKYPDLARRLEDLDCVEAATAMLSAQGLVHLGKGNVKPVLVWGIEFDRRGKVTAFDNWLVAGSVPTADANGSGIRGIVGIGVIAEPNEQTDEYDMAAVRQSFGQQAVITTGSALRSDDAGQPRFRRRTIPFIISDAAVAGVYWLDNRIVYLPIERLQDALYADAKEPLADQLLIKLKPGSDADAAIAQVRGIWSDFASNQLGWEPLQAGLAQIETSRRMQQDYVAEIRKQMGVLLVIFGVVSLSVVLLVFCIFYMIVATRRKDIAIIKSCGSSGGSVATIFIGFGGCIGVIGSALGLIIGYIVTTNINIIEEWVRIIFGLKLWKSSVYLFSRIPNEVDWNAAFGIAVFAVIAAAAGALVPAISAALTRPVNVLRYE